MGTRYHRDLKAPFGTIRIVAESGAIVALHFEDNWHLCKSEPLGKSERTGKSESTGAQGLIDRAIVQLEEYFVGARQEFDIPVRPSGTDFQRAVYRALLDIRFGETRSYSDVARAVGRPDAVRAVGAANGQNPISIIVPCHRVIGKNGSLTGYGGGIETKRWLLDLEKPQLFPMAGRAASSVTRPAMTRG
ncbi:methylated-DNA--[protein]-cysteine S-methyltransferase [Pendulispora albinea]|uniref:methylated-DNA--[protein]-cysteine S-methyltransferase n=1 Tax=Pendulispora albinea TaxID=2741071 RepID=UPI00374DFFF4